MTVTLNVGVGTIGSTAIVVWVCRVASVELLCDSDGGGWPARTLQSHNGYQEDSYDFHDFSPLNGLSFGNAEQWRFQILLKIDQSCSSYVRARFAPQALLSFSNVQRVIYELIGYPLMLFPFRDERNLHVSQ